MREGAMIKYVGALVLASLPFLAWASTPEEGPGFTDSELGKSSSATVLPRIHVRSFEVVMTMPASSSSVWLSGSPGTGPHIEGSSVQILGNFGAAFARNGTAPSVVSFEAAVEKTNELLQASANNPTSSQTSNQADITAHSGAIVASPVPEPEIWAMMLVGAGLVGFRLRHRSKRFAAHRFG